MIHKHFPHPTDCAVPLRSACAVPLLLLCNIFSAKIFTIDARTRIANITDGISNTVVIGGRAWVVRGRFIVTTSPVQLNGSSQITGASMWAGSRGNGTSMLDGGHVQVGAGGAKLIDSPCIGDTTCRRGSSNYSPVGNTGADGGNRQARIEQSIIGDSV